MLDLICQRYPSRRPSDYLEIDDPSIALQLDYAIALKYHLQDLDYDASKLESTHSILKSIGTAGFGIEWKEKKEKKEQAKVQEGLPVDVALKMFGGKGVQVKK